jgi:D-serine deaminase-like pyridoxal phosphate-dependent protein
LIDAIDDIDRLRPHIKTHKSPQITGLMLKAGIKKFKCATIAEAEMLAVAGAKDILLAYQPIGPKIKRFAELTEKFMDCKFACLVDNAATASEISNVFIQHNSKANAYIDLNVGMNRTGIEPTAALELFDTIRSLRGLIVEGLHAYDGHLRDEDFTLRKKKCDEAFTLVQNLALRIKKEYNAALKIVAGGTPTFSIHSKRPSIECSPGTFIYWDKGYEKILGEQQYQFGALVLCRIISNPSDNIFAIDLGHKAIASENPLANRVTFLNAPDVQPIGHSEEHLVIKSESQTFKVGEVLYGVPYHICPTVALYDEVNVVTDGKVADHWYNVSRNRKLTI